ncbi:MAG: arylsulfatase [Candidatus Hydrogenedentes bacterium]|nr:arylsulfatase [Candidatus Hydrogenedentota bacterium]
MHVTRREWLRAAAAGAVASAAPRTGYAASSAKPNIIFILADDLGYGDLGCYGQDRIKTPNLDRMATEGVRFTQCYAGSTVCAPSRCALMTGLHTGHCWIRGNARVPLRPDDVTVAELLKGAGYSTGLIGKWGLGNEDTTGTPNKQGFDYFFGYLDQGHAHNYYPAFLWRNEQRVPLRNTEDPKNKGVAVERVEYSHDLFAAEALTFVEQHRSEPFFLYLALTIPHANNEGGRATGDGMEVPDYGPYKDEPWPVQEKGKAAMITRMDADIGRLFAKLKEFGIDDNTLVLFSSDNGPHKEGNSDPEFFKSSGPLRGYKRALYEGGIRVPGIARWPGRIPPERVSNLPWAFWDVLPTLCEIAGVEAPTGNDGISIAPTLLSMATGGEAAQPQHEFFYWEFHEQGSKQAVRMGNWKAVRLAQGAPLELYDLATDIGETRNVAADQPDIIAKIEAFLANVRTPNEHWPMKQASDKKPQ